MEKSNNETDIAYAVNSPSQNVTFDFYKVCQSTNKKLEKKYCVQNSSLKEIKHFNSFSEAKNYARYCSAAVSEYLNGQSKIGEDFSYSCLESRLNEIASDYAIFEEDSRSLFVKEHGYGPSVSYKAMERPGIMGWNHFIRWENIETNVVFENKKDALNALNNYLSISDWEVYDWKFGERA